MLSSLLRRRRHASSLLRSTMTSSQPVWHTAATRAFSVTGDDDELYAEEDIPETGEWAGCKRSFMAPLLIRTRGSETLYNRRSSSWLLPLVFCWLLVVDKSAFIIQCIAYTYNIAFYLNSHSHSTHSTFQQRNRLQKGRTRSTALPWSLARTNHEHSPAKGALLANTARRNLQNQTKHFARRFARSQRDALSPRLGRSYGRNGTLDLHTHGWTSLRRIRNALSTPSWNVFHARR